MWSLLRSREFDKGALKKKKKTYTKWKKETRQMKTFLWRKNIMA